MIFPFSVSGKINFDSFLGCTLNVTLFHREKCPILSVGFDEIGKARTKKVFTGVYIGGNTPVNRHFTHYMELCNVDM